MGTMKSIKRAIHTALERGHCLHISVIPPITDAGEEERDMGSIKETNEAINAEAADAETMDELKPQLIFIASVFADKLHGQVTIPVGTTHVYAISDFRGGINYGFYSVERPENAAAAAFDPQDNGKDEAVKDGAADYYSGLAEVGEEMIRAESTARMAPPVFQMGQHVCLARVYDACLRRAAEQRRDVTANPPAQRGPIIAMSSFIDGRPAEYLVRHLTPEGELIDKWYSEDALINDRF